jgi:hypothetical protein
MQPSSLCTEDSAVSGRIFSPCLHPGMTVVETRLFNVVGVAGSASNTWGTERRFSDAPNQSYLLLLVLIDAWIGRRSTRVSPRHFFARSALRTDSASAVWAGGWECEGLCQSPFVSLQKMTTPPAKLYLRRRSVAQLSQEKVSFARRKGWVDDDWKRVC